MASAAAVAADQARSPIGGNLGEDHGIEGEVTSGARPEDGDAAGVNGNAGEEDDDEDEDLPSNPLRGSRRPRPTNGTDEEEEDEEGGGDDLFGDEEEGAGEQEKPVRQLDDEELDSGDDMERSDRVADEPEPEYIAQEKITMDLEYPRLPGPEPTDGEMYLLKMPSFMTVEPNAWHHTTFQPPTTDHHNFGRPASDTFSAAKTALSTLRWRHSPSNPQQLQSNARILRWSDGSLTLQLASDPETQYELDGKAVAPPQRNPVKPTPTSIQSGNKGGRQGMGTHPGEKFDSRRDAFTYLCRPYDENGTMIVTQKITTGLTVRAPSDEEDEAVLKLKASLAAANASKHSMEESMHMIPTDENPEKARNDALAAMKEIEKKNKKAQAAQEREAARANRALGRSGLASSRYGGLNASMLEDDEEGGASGRSRGTQQKRPKPRRRRNSEYSEDEDFGRKRFSKEDEYEEDDFLVGSDEEEEVVEDDDDPDDGIVEEERPRRERTPKRGREEEEEEEDAPGEEEDDVPAQGRGAGGVKKRRVVDDEDEDD